MTRRSNGKGLSRRAMLRGLGGSMVALPFLDAMVGIGRRAEAQTLAFPKRIVMWYTPNGTVPKNFWPEAPGSLADSALSPILQPLSEHRNDMLVLGGIDLMTSYDGPGDAHQKGTGTCLTGMPLQDGDFAGDAGASAGWADGISLDQHIANEIGGDTMFRSLEAGVLVQGSSVRSRVSYRGPAQPLPPENNPYTLYRRLLGDPSLTPEDIARQNQRRQLVLDTLSDDYKKLRGQLSGDDSYKLENHLEALQSIEERLSKSQVEFGGECQRYAQGDPINVEAVGNMPDLGTLQMDLVAMAFACDLTRVSTIMWSQSTASHLYKWVDDEIREGHHLLAHKGDQDTKKVEQNTAINRWHAEQLAYFVSKLKSIPEGDGTVFDNTVIFWTNEQSKGNVHSRAEMPYVVMGSAGGYFQTGQYVQYPSETPHNKLLVSLMNAMGVPGDSFGSQEYGTGSLTGLT
ncbi:DUF1552 domain-containing protein [Haliangium ochraceum]|uniref:Tat (Twin-arginine translocation) pathway signal sequence domain protein n=1 Tax=Haliangium ochraceum (strain DSM 14365 / JCM 11303 / SMP-2) TaxID=502025 RepID=D0LFP0_HALO1|nr:DUF1552 domain-containing protein [Haliangium ochraceum]ACY12674.1 protein of unknown function DUF1552 [Haliangium ochraceum DSM 14365]